MPDGGEELSVGELLVALSEVFMVLDHARRHTRALQQVHYVMRELGPRPLLNMSIQLILTT
jgi:hypothetical protein